MTQGHSGLAQAVTASSHEHERTQPLCHFGQTLKVIREPCKSVAKYQHHHEDNGCSSTTMAVQHAPQSGARTQIADLHQEIL